MDDISRQFKDLKKALETASLSNAERTKIKNKVNAFMKLQPRKKAAFAPRMQPSPLSAYFMHRPGFVSFKSASFALSFVLVAGIGTSYAAQQALPGDSLYALKIHVTEPVEGALVAAHESQAQWDATLADRRLTEAETLAVKGDLTPVNDAILKAQLDTVTKKFDADVATLATTQDGAAKVADAQSNLKASLSAHAEALSTIASTTPSAQSEVVPLIALVTADAKSVDAASDAQIAIASSKGASTSTPPLATTSARMGAGIRATASTSLATTSEPKEATTTDEILETAATSSLVAPIEMHASTSVMLKSAKLKLTR